MQMFKGLLIATITVMSCQPDASIRRYKANNDATTINDQTQWVLSADTRLHCGMTHTIPRFGDVLFSSVASKNLNLEFEMDMFRVPANYALASVKSIAPDWQPGVPTKSITTMELKKQFNPDMPQKAAWTMLTELEKGFVPTIYYADWYSPFDKIAVSLSAMHFTKPYEAFLKCLDNLLPYSFDDISYTILNYESNSDVLSRRSKKRLTQIGEYLKHSPEIDEIAINAYADSYGGRWPNMELSKKRSKKIKTFLTSIGVDKSRVVVQGFGEKRHVASNKTELGRETNRRVVIQMTKP
jgi:outer membrane protein OmpA-like peptidoglycan-associated protein